MASSCLSLVYKLDAQRMCIVCVGELFLKLSQFCGWGYVMACAAKVKGAESEVEGMGNLLVNHPYSIVACKELEDGTRLIKLQNCWGSGTWTGPWPPGSEKWKTPGILESSNEAEILAMSERGYFWMEYK